MSVPNIFLSAATDDFEDVRESLAEQLRQAGCVVQHQGDFTELGVPTMDKLDAYLRDCTLVLHLVGGKCGSVAKKAALDGFLAALPKPLLSRPGCEPLHTAIHTDGLLDKLTYTQWEAYLAVHYNIPLLVYRPQTIVDCDERQNEHLARLRTVGLYPNEYNDEQHLKTLILTSLHKRLLNDFPLQAKLLDPQKKPIHLPYQSIGTLFKGRDEFLAGLHDKLRQAGDGRAMAVCGKAVHSLGGVGKTRLAVEYAWRHADDYSAVLCVTADSAENLRRNLADLVGPLVMDLPEQEVPEEEARVGNAVADF